MNYWKHEDGVQFPLGSAWDEVNQGFNFSLYSKTATLLKLLFFKKDTPQQVVFTFQFDPIKNKTGSVWHCFIKEQLLNNADSYAYRADGPVSAGNFFDVSKLLLDPWAKAIAFPATFSRAAAIGGGDNTGKAMLSLLVKQDSDPPGFNTDTQPVHFHDLIIYEIHVKGFTADISSGINNPLRGTYAGIIEKIPYLLELGITAVELMPVHQFDPQENNYWGYMTLNFFVPHQQYGSNTDGWAIMKEFKTMVQALHNAGMEVILDVVFNHTTEGNKFGPNYSYRGIDNSSYYLLTPDLNNYIDDAGTGNVLRTSYKMVRKLVLDSLRYWVEEMHVDGFRFDLASIFTRNDDASINFNNPPILEEISMDPVLSKVRLIAEPWDINSYQLGQRFPGASWAQWNGAYRDNIRKFIKGDTGMVARAMSGIYGSADIFPDHPPYNGKPYQSINFVTCHDGFSLYDLVAYNSKHNDQNGFNNTDGTNDNYSWNCDWEGDINVPAGVMNLRKKQAKNILTVLMFSNGIPMFRMGDEFLLTQNGNNNPFNQDNAISYLDWNRKTQFEDFFRYTKMIIALRKAHESICRGNFWRDDVKWFGVNGQTDISYFSRTMAFLLNGQSVNDDDFYVMINCYWEPLNFNVQVADFTAWKRIIDTSLGSPLDIIDFSGAPAVTSITYQVKERSVVVLQRRKV